MYPFTQVFIFNSDSNQVKQNYKTNERSHLSKALHSFAFWNSLLFIVGLAVFIYRQSVMMSPYFRPHNSFPGRYIWGIALVELIAIFLLLFGCFCGILESINEGKPISRDIKLFGFYPDKASYWSSICITFGVVLFAVPLTGGFVIALSVEVPTYSGLIRAFWLITLVASFMWLYSSLIYSWTALQAVGWLNPRSVQWWSSIFFTVGSCHYIVASISGLVGPTKWNTTFVFLIGNVIYSLGSVSCFVLLCISYKQKT